MIILMTGASGFLGSLLATRLLEKGHKIYSVSRHSPELREHLVALRGDITEKGLGLSKEVFPERFDACYHLAGILRLGEDKGGSIWRTNVDGTQNVIDFCFEHAIPHLYFVSTAYTEGRNTYEKSKALCEEMATKSSIPGITIFKPSVVMGTLKHPYPGHFSQFVRLLVKMHRGAETARRTVEEALALPVIEPVFRIKGNPRGYLNLVSVDDVIDGMLDITGTGTYYLTNPSPPTLGELVTWVGEYIKVDLRILPSFKPTIIEKQFQRMATAFASYLEGDSFHSDIKRWTPISRYFIYATVGRALYPID